MINKVSSYNAKGIKFQGNSNILDKFKENLKNYQINTPINLNGNEAIANYNKAIIVNENNIQRPEEKIEQFFIKETINPIILKGNEIETLSGERFTNENGDLEAIIIKGDKTSKEYIIDSDKKYISEIIERDNSGNPVRIDRIDDIYNKNSSLYTFLFEPDSNKISKEVYFDEGKLSHITLFDNKTNKSVENSFDKAGNLISITLNDKNTGLTTHYLLDDKKQIKYIEVCDENYNTLRDLSYKDGKLEDMREYKYKPFNNYFGITPDNITLKPATFIEKPEIKSINGEKKFRPNGTLKSITTNNGDIKTEYLIDYSGKNVNQINELDKDKKIKSINFSEKGTSNIQEFKNEKLYKTTYYGQNQKPDCIIEYNENGDISRIVEYSTVGNYIRRYIEENNPEFGHINLKFNKDKALIGLDIQNKEELKPTFEN